MWQDEDDDGYRDELLEDGMEDHSDEDQQELEALLYGQIHYQANPAVDTSNSDDLKKVVCSVQVGKKDKTALPSTYSTRTDIELNKPDTDRLCVLSADVFGNEVTVISEESSLDSKVQENKDTKKHKKSAKRKALKRLQKGDSKKKTLSTNASTLLKSVKESVVILSNSDFEPESPCRNSPVKAVTDEDQDCSVLIIEDPNISDEVIKADGRLKSDAPCVISDGEANSDSMVLIESSPDAIKSAEKEKADGSLGSLANLAVSLSKSLAHMEAVDHSSTSIPKRTLASQDSEVIVDSASEGQSDSSRDSGAESDTNNSSDSEIEDSESVSSSDGDSDIMILDERVKDDVDDIKLMNIHGITMRGNTEEAMLKEVLDSLQDGTWKLDDEDISSAKGRRRYYGNSNIVCKNCDNKGHIAKNCPQPKRAVTCSLCAKMGHQHWSCPQSLCHNCDRPGHASRECGEPWRSNKESCFRCGMVGHFIVNCPDLWRQFHLTIKRGPLKKGSETVTKKIYCYNCADRGHFGHECNLDFLHSYVYPPTPFIAKYQLPRELKSHNQRNKHQHHHQQPDKSVDKGRHSRHSPANTNKASSKPQDREERLRKKKSYKNQVKKSIEDVHGQTEKVSRRSKKKLRKELEKHEVKQMVEDIHHHGTIAQNSGRTHLQQHYTQKDQAARKRKHIQWDDNESAPQDFKRQKREASTVQAGYSRDQPGKQRNQPRQGAFEEYGQTVDLTNYQVSIPNSNSRSKRRGKRQEEKHFSSSAAHQPQLYDNDFFQQKKSRYDQERPFSQKEYGGGQWTGQKKSSNKSHSRSVKSSNDRGFRVSFNK